MTPAAAVSSPKSVASDVVLVPGVKFFVRRVPLSDEGDPATQVELALETLSPFPLTQLYHGYVTDAERKEAVVFAAYRRNFTAEETAAWNGATHVLPDFVAWLAPQSPPRPAGVAVREHDGLVETVAWDGKSALPAMMVVRPVEAADAAELPQQIRAKCGLEATAPLRRIVGPGKFARDKRGLVLRAAPGEAETVFSPAALQALDVREKGFLAAQQQQWRRDRIMWRIFAGTLAALAVCIALEVALAGLRGWLRVRRTAVDARAPAVAQVEAANSLGVRLEQISSQRLRPFEMLAAVNSKRPAAVEFTRVTTAGLWRMDIEAQTPSAAEPGDFERDLRALPTIERVDLRDSRTREGVTTFRLEVTFRPGWTRGGGA